MTLNLQEKQVSGDDCILALGCLLMSGTLMATEGSLCREQPDTWVPDTKSLSEAVLGGPLIGSGGKFLGMNHKYRGDANTTFLSQKFLCERTLPVFMSYLPQLAYLYFFQILSSRQLIHS